MAGLKSRAEPSTPAGRRRLRDKAPRLMRGRLKSLALGFVIPTPPLLSCSCPRPVFMRKRYAAGPFRRFHDWVKRPEPVRVNSSSRKFSVWEKFCADVECTLKTGNAGVKAGASSDAPAVSFRREATPAVASFRLLA